MFGKLYTKCLLPDLDELALGHDGNHARPLGGAFIPLGVQGGSLDGQIAGLHGADLAAVEGELDLALDLDDQVQADGAVHGTGRVRGRVEVSHHGAAAGGHERRQLLQTRLVGLEVGLVGEYPGAPERDVPEPLRAPPRSLATGTAIGSAVEKKDLLSAS